MRPKICLGNFRWRISPCEGSIAAPEIPPQEGPNDIRHELTDYTDIHVAISLIGIVSGLIVLAGMFSAKPMNGLTALFLSATAATSITGYGFPFVKVTPADILGALSLLVLAIAVFARYSKLLAGGWQRTYVISAVIALYFNVFVLVVQSFEKVPALHALAPTQKEAPFAVTQLLLLVLFVIAGVMAVKRFRPDAPSLKVKLAA